MSKIIAIAKNGKLPRVSIGGRDAIAAPTNASRTTSSIAKVLENEFATGEYCG